MANRISGLLAFMAIGRRRLGTQTGNRNGGFVACKFHGGQLVHSFSNSNGEGSVKNISRGGGIKGFYGQSGYPFLKAGPGNNRTL